jgi:hypothetical protein
MSVSDPLSAMQDQMEHHYEVMAEQSAEIAALRAENAKLLKALEWIAFYDPEHDGNNGWQAGFYAIQGFADGAIGRAYPRKEEPDV